MLDHVIRNARILDGTGAPATFGDVGINQGKIVFVGDGSRERGRNEVNADGRTLAPGFWDPHTHLEYDMLLDQSQVGLVAQGVTTTITGNCGTSMYPTKSLRGVLTNSAGLEQFEWRGMRQYAGLVHHVGTPINSSPLIANGSLRYEVMGNDDRQATPDELRQMLTLLEDGLQEGAIGLSSGLDYIPSLYSDTDELVEFCKVVAKYGGVYASHTRDCSPIYAYSYHATEVLAPASERALHLNGVLELIEIGRKSGARVHLSHLHASGIVGTEMAAVREARRQGVDITVDAMSYNVSYSIRSDLLLRRVKERSPDLVNLSIEEARARMQDPLFQGELSRRPQLRRHISPERAGTWELSRTGSRNWDGRTVAQLAAEQGKTHVEMMFSLILDEQNPVGIVPPASVVKPVPIEQIDDPLIMPISDALASDPADPYGTYSARGYVSTVRFWEMARAYGISEEEIVRHLTTLPARRFGVWDRGAVAVGQQADLVLFSPDDYRATADTHEPFNLASGMEWIFVNGVPILASGERTANLPGKILLKERVPTAA
ncbi:MAG: amidohydrolase family protein [Thermomicrobiales bacterium]|nr:amidohydrolase family protein [Thermomicrobiales bacterium]